MKYFVQNLKQEKNIHTHDFYISFTFIKKKLVISEYLFEIIQLNATNFFTIMKSDRFTKTNINIKNILD